MYYSDIAPLTYKSDLQIKKYRRILQYVDDRTV